MGREDFGGVVKQCVNYGTRVQNSVFECLMDAAKCREDILTLQKCEYRADMKNQVDSHGDLIWKLKKFWIVMYFEILYLLKTYNN